MTLMAVVANTTADANCASPPNFEANIGVVEAVGMADCRTMIALIKGVSEPKKPVTSNAVAGTTINLHKAINAMGRL